MSKLNRLYDAPAATSRMTVEYLRPVPLRTPLQVRSRNISKRGRRLTHTAEIRDEKGTVLARSRGVFVIICAGHVFHKRKQTSG
jgi:acyl-CoA thioesterase FadM